MVHRHLRGSRRGHTLLEAAAGIFLLFWVVLLYAAAYPASHRASRMSVGYAQAVSAVQHKIDQLRSVGYGRLKAGELQDAGIIDAPVDGAPFRFEGVDQLAASLLNPVGTITVASAGSNISLVTVHLEWQQSPSAPRSSHEIQLLIANE